ncbi:MerR family transcriptional regulator [Nocardioides gansuensis]|uniref:MerR family transcriptional regulator n=1 Tax=Nocardioides gansuensis TaxID=2138300 RepID=A0A2T8FCH3_9ACTN|nr:MerR family transcriptional regulator [Nocardioides gansuensis]
MQGQVLDLAPQFRVYRGWVRISELADRVGVPTSTVRYYERIGLLGVPGRTGSGYRDYGEDSATHLLFVHRARRMGLSCDQIAELLPVWGGANCAGAHDRVGLLIDEKQAEIAERINELEEFARQLHEVRSKLEASPPAAECRTDLSCCVPSGDIQMVQLELAPRGVKHSRR